VDGEREIERGAGPSSGKTCPAPNRPEGNHSPAVLN